MFFPVNQHSLTVHHHTQNRKIDMTADPIMRSVLLFALPIILGDILQ